MAASDDAIAARGLPSGQSQSRGRAVLVNLASDTLLVSLHSVWPLRHAWTKRVRWYARVLAQVACRRLGTARPAARRGLQHGYGEACGTARRAARLRLGLWHGALIGSRRRLPCASLRPRKRRVSRTSSSGRGPRTARTGPPV